MGETKSLNRNNKKKTKHSRFIKYIVLFSLCFYVGWVLISQQIQIEANKKVISSLDASIEQQKQVQSELENKKQIVNTPEYMEKIAREKLDLVKPDEIVFVDATQKK